MPLVTDRLKAYPSDLSDAQWECIRDFIPKARSGGRRRTTNVRKIIDGVLYLVSSGCAWRYLPKDFPPWKTVYGYYRLWIFDGVWKRIHEFLKKQTRVSAGKNELPTYLIIDSQSVKAQSGDDLGYDGFKRVRGRKRQILVDTLGLIHGIHIHSAALSDPKEGCKILETMPDELCESMQVMSADMGYRGSFEDSFFFKFGFLPLIIKRENTGQGKKKKCLEKKYWKRTREKIVQPKRWIVERTFAWFNGYRRLSRDYEKKLYSSETMMYLAMIQLMLRRCYPMP